jgi:hypothetical protein
MLGAQINLVRMPLLIKTFRDFLLMRVGPQDLPYSPRLLFLMALFFCWLDLQQRRLGYAQIESTPSGTSVPSHLFGVVVFSCLFQLIVPWIALSVVQKTPRYVQTALGSLVVSILVTLLSMPLIFGLGTLPKDAQSLSTTQVLVAWLSLFLVAWQIALQAHVYRHALDISFRTGVLCVVGLMGVEIILGLLLFGNVKG